MSVSSADSRPVHRWIVYICVMQAPNTIFLRLNQEMLSVWRVVAVEQSKVSAGRKTWAGGGCAFSVDYKQDSDVPQLGY